jgi:hypothetical protein
VILASSAVETWIDTTKMFNLTSPVAQLPRPSRKLKAIDIIRQWFYIDRNELCKSSFLLLWSKIVIFVKHELKGVLKYKGRNLDPSPTDLKDIALECEIEIVRHFHHRSSYRQSIFLEKKSFVLNNLWNLFFVECL